MDPDTEDRISIEEAAGLLGLSTKTIQRYLASGLLTKVKTSHRTRLLKAEVEALGRARSTPKNRQAVRSAFQTSDADVVTISRARYESLLIELGELRKACELLSAAESRRQELESALRAAEAELTRTRQLLDRKWESRATPTDVSDYGHPERPEPTREVPTPSRKPWWQK